MMDPSRRSQPVNDDDVGEELEHLIDARGLVGPFEEAGQELVLGLHHGRPPDPMIPPLQNAVEGPGFNQESLVTSRVSKA